MSYLVEQRLLERTPTLAIRVVIGAAETAGVMGSLFAEIFALVERTGVAIAGPAYARYFSLDPEKLEVECGVPVAAGAKGEGRVRCAELPGGPALSTWHVGPYETLSEAYEALVAWAEANGSSAASSFWEMYHTDPQHEPDPARWRTEVFLPLEQACAPGPCDRGRQDAEPSG